MLDIFNETEVSAYYFTSEVLINLKKRAENECNEKCTTKVSDQYLTRVERVMKIKCCNFLD